MKEEIESDFCIEIDFEEDSLANPSRIFKAMSGLIEGIQLLDSSLLQTIDVKIQTQLMLRTIQVGSLKSWFRNVIEIADDESLKSGKFKAILGKYLLEAKHWILKHIKDKENLKGEKLKVLQDKLQEIAEETKVRKIPSYAPVKREKLVEFSIKTLESTSVPTEKDKAKYVSRCGQITLPKGPVISDEAREEMLTEKNIVDETQLVLRIKKPDYLGESKWMFQWEKHPMEAKIEDKEWLSRFQTREILVRPGDSLKVRVRTEIKKGYDDKDISVRYDILKVLQVIPATDAKQSNFFL